MNLKNRNERKTRESKYNYQLKQGPTNIFQGNNQKSNKVSVDNK